MIHVGKLASLAQAISLISTVVYGSSVRSRSVHLAVVYFEANGQRTLLRVYFD